MSEYPAPLPFWVGKAAFLTLMLPRLREDYPGTPDGAFFKVLWDGIARGDLFCRVPGLKYFNSHPWHTIEDWGLSSYNRDIVIALASVSDCELSDWTFTFQDQAYDYEIERLRIERLYERKFRARSQFAPPAASAAPHATAIGNSLIVNINSAPSLPQSSGEKPLAPAEGGSAMTETGLTKRSTAAEQQPAAQSKPREVKERRDRRPNTEDVAAIHQYLAVNPTHGEKRVQAFLTTQGRGRISRNKLQEVVASCKDVRRSTTQEGAQIQSAGSVTNSPRKRRN